MKTKTNTNPNHIDDLMLEVIDMQNATNDLEDASYENDIEFKARNSSRCSESGTEKDDSTDNENDKEDEKEDFTCRKCALRTLLFFVLSAILFGALFATGILRNEDLSGIPVLGDLDLEGFFDTDPYGGLITPETPETAYRWYAPQQSGLQLTVLNALTNDWQQEFEKAMAQWDAGDPDTLTLHSERVEVDVPCEPLNGLLKVCNGDYGATDWRGLNVVLLDMQEKWIYSSTAKMNEHFLSRASAAQRQYTMCHELGHGFGLVSK